MPPRSRTRLKGQKFRQPELFELLIEASISLFLCDLRPTLAVRLFGELALLAAIYLRRARAKMPPTPTEAVLMSASPPLRNMDRPAIHILRPQNPSISLGLCGLRTICPARPFGGLSLLGTTCSPQKGGPRGCGQKIQKCQQLALFEPPLEAAIHRFLCDLRPPLPLRLLGGLASLGTTCPPQKGGPQMPARSPRKLSGCVQRHVRSAAGQQQATAARPNETWMPEVSTSSRHFALTSPRRSPLCSVTSEKTAPAPSLEALRSLPQSAVRRGSPNTKPIRRHIMSRFPPSMFVPVSSVSVPQGMRERCSDER